MKRIKVGFFHPDPGEISSWYRAMGPLLELQKTHDNIEISIIEPRRDKDGKFSINWPEIRYFDWILMMRPCDPMNVKLMERAKDFKVKTWIDHDDDLLNLPASHGEWEFFSSDQTRECAAFCLHHADVVTCTTNNLAKVFSQFNPKKLQVIPNAINDYLWPEPTPFNEIANRLISWRGGNSHGEDIRSVLNEIVKLNVEGFRFLFIGARPTMIYGKLMPGSFSHIPWQHVEIFPAILEKQRPILHITPLAMDSLNKSKSNISWLESTWFGGTVNLTKKGLDDDHWGYSFFYENPKDFSTTAKEVIESRSVRKLHYEKSVSMIRDKFVLSKTNQMRMEILNG